MKKILSILFNGWVLAFIGFLALSLLIWIVGPLIAVGQARPLDSAWARLGLIGLLVGSYVLFKLYQGWKAKRTNNQVVNKLLTPPSGAQTPTESAEVKVLRERFEQGLQTLRNARFESTQGVWNKVAAKAGKRYLYELPWYIIIGA
ncbi:MAG TPA: hypothetical protein VFH49_14790, partial [Aquabacterium sp.]|nr:hypothetical protein [Aquabacterium sp.]